MRTPVPTHYDRPVFRHILLTVTLLAAAPGAASAGPIAQDFATLGSWQRGTRLGSMVQTPEGYLWLATNAGLLRFDGIRFVAFTKTSTPGLPTNNVRALVGGADGSLVVGFDDGGGIARVDAATGAPHVVNTGRSLAGESVRALLVTADGLVWVGTTRGLWRWDKGIMEKIAAPASAAWPGAITGIVERGVGAKRSGSVFVGTAGGLLSVTPGASPVVIPGLGPVSALLSDGRGGAFVADAGGLWSLDAPGPPRPMPAPPVDLGPVRSLARSPQGALLVGFARGLGRFRNGDWEMLPGGGPIDHLMPDREGGLWTGHNNGSFRRLGPARVRTVGPVDRANDNNAPAMGLAAFTDGRVFAAFPRRVIRIGGSIGGSIGRAGGDSRVWINEASPPHVGLRALAAGGDGTLWLGATDGGLLRLAKDGTAIEPVPYPLSAGQAIQILFEDRHGSLYIGHRNGTLAVRDTHGFTPIVLPTKPCATPVNGGPGPECAATISAFANDPSGGVWMGTRGSGLFHINGQTVRRLGRNEGVPFDRIDTLLMDADGSLWMGGDDKGLARRRPDPGDRGQQGPQNDIFERIADDAGMPSQNVLALVDDLAGNLWMGSDLGLFRVRRQVMEFVAEKRQTKIEGTLFDNRDGVPPLRAARALPLAAVRATDGTVWFTTSRGAVGITPPGTWGAVPPLRALVENVQLDGRPLLPRKNRGLELPSGAGAVEFTYTAPTFIAPHALRFQHRLDGFDNDWVDAGDRRVALYARLPAGVYAFRIRARRSDGDGEPAETTIALRVTSVYERWPFWLSMGIGITAFGFIGHRVRVRMERMTIGGDLCPVCVGSRWFGGPRPDIFAPWPWFRPGCRARGLRGSAATIVPVGSRCLTDIVPMNRAGRGRCGCVHPARRETD